MVPCDDANDDGGGDVGLTQLVLGVGVLLPSCAHADCNADGRDDVGNDW